jgi:hypothetical protein
MSSQLSELIRDARRELRVAAGSPLTSEEREEDRRKDEVMQLRKFVLSRLGVRVPDQLNAKVNWTAKGPALIFNADGRVFQMRVEGDSYPLFIIEGDSEREVARLEGADPHFASRLLVAVANAVPSLE